MDEFNLVDVKVGDTLVVVPHHRQVKVGRDLVYVENARKPVPYQRADGYERRSRNAPGIGSRAYTPEGHALRERRNELFRRFVVATRAGWSHKLTTEQLERILAIIDEGN